jgi:AcrR family transcriptional regulator
MNECSRLTLPSATGRVESCRQAVRSASKQAAKTLVVSKARTRRAAAVKRPRAQRTNTTDPAAASAPSGAPAEPRLPLREPRVARRKRETRTRLLDAAFRLMAARGADGVAIHEITEAADVATGGFYNHFKSKEDLYIELTKRVFDDFADALDDLVAEVEDPAEVIAVCIRQTVLRARREPLWAQFLVREGLAGDAWTRGLGSRLHRDIKAGIERGRFKLADPVMSFIATGGAVLAALAAQRHATANADAVAAALTDMGERVALVALQILGLTASQSERVAHKPLPSARLRLAISDSQIHELVRYERSTAADVRAGRQHGVASNWPTPEPQHFVSQLYLEPVLGHQIASYAKVPYPDQQQPRRRPRFRATAAPSCRRAPLVHGGSESSGAWLRAQGPTCSSLSARKPVDHAAIDVPLMVVIWPSVMPTGSAVSYWWTRSTPALTYGGRNSPRVVIPTLAGNGSLPP